jgi:hypothetical protein
MSHAGMRMGGNPTIQRTRMHALIYTFCQRAARALEKLNLAILVSKNDFTGKTITPRRIGRFRLFFFYLKKENFLQGGLNSDF